MPSINDLKLLQALPLDLKIAKTKARIKEWVDFYGIDGVYISFSGGKDSTVLLHIARLLYPSIDAVFVDTGLEYPEVRAFVKTFDNVTILRPEMRFDEVIKTYGYPIISKEVSECVYQGRLSLKKGLDKDDFLAWKELIIMSGFKEIPFKSNVPYSYRLQKLMGTAKDKNGNKSLFCKEKYKPLLYTDFVCSHYCCNVMKKKPIKSYAKKTGKKAITAQMASESFLRSQQWLKNGCNGFNMKKPISNPMSFWTEQDIYQYIKENHISIASVYGDIVYKGNDGLLYQDNLCGSGELCTTGNNRTGCIFCAFGAHLEKGESRFQRLKRTHPQQYEYCCGGGEYANGIWQPNQKGLGMGHVFNELNKIYGKDFIKY
nr:MAG TPA: phosphoadenosine-phosphosulfate reductase [Caudoviricetes sp.]